MAARVTSTARRSRRLIQGLNGAPLKGGAVWSASTFSNSVASAGGVVVVVAISWGRGSAPRARARCAVPLFIADAPPAWQVRQQARTATSPPAAVWLYSGRLEEGRSLRSARRRRGKSRQH